MESRIRALFTSLIFHALLPDVTCFSIFFSSCLVFFALLSNFLLSPFSLCLFCSYRDVSDAAGPPWPSWLRTPPCWAPWLWGAATTPTTTWNASSWTSSNGHAPPRASVRLSHGWVGCSHLPHPHAAFLQLLLSHLLSTALPYFSFLDFFSLSPCLSSLCIVPVWTVSCFLFLLFSFSSCRSPRSYASAWYAWTSSTDAPSWIHWPSTTSTLRLPAGAPPSTQTHSPASSSPSRPTSRPSSSVISHCLSSCYSLPISVHFLGPIRVAVAPRG